MEKVFGGAIVPTLLKLALLSLAAGLVFAVFGIDPMDLWRNFGSTIEHAWRITIEALDWSWRYAALGAIVVLPCWIIYRLILAVTSRPKG